MSLLLPFAIWVAIFASWMIVTILRWSAGRSEDDHIHVMESDQVIAHQNEIAHKLDVLDRWKAILLTIMLVYGLVLGAFHLYNVWLQGNASLVG